MFSWFVQSITPIYRKVGDGVSTNTLLTEICALEVKTWRIPEKQSTHDSCVIPGLIFGLALLCWVKWVISPALQLNRKGPSKVPGLFRFFLGVHFRVTSPRRQRLKPNRFAVGNLTHRVIENGPGTVARIHLGHLRVAFIKSCIGIDD